MTDLGRIGAYRLLAELGRGGAGTVYRGLGPTGEAVALKALTPGGSDAQGVARFLRESQLRIEHPNVVRTLGGGVADDGRPYVVQELLAGATLRAAFPRMSREEIVDAVRQASLGVGALHAVGLVHRDLKPENLFLCDDGTVKVLDLGIATWVDGRVGLTATGTVVGTPAYLSPEQARGERPIDARSDVWALGAVLYEGLAGHSPFARGSVLATMLAVSIDPLRPLRQARPDVSRRLEAIVERCLERSPEHRYADASALAMALGQPTEPSPAEHVPTAATPRRARPRRSVAMLLAPDVARAEGFVARCRAEGAEPVLLRDGRGIALFGGTISRGDETQRALALARALAPDAGPIAIALGWAEMDGASPSGAVIEEAEAALAGSGGRGAVVCGPVTSRAFGETAAERAGAAGTFDVDTVQAPEPSPSRLVGRAAELATLERARDAAIGEERVVTSWIVGSAGAGKSRLADVVPALAARGGEPMQIRRAHAGRVGARMFSLWSRALDIAPARVSVEPLDASVRTDQAREEILETLGREIEVGPLAIVLEDVQWADPASMELLPLVVERFEGRPVWIVLTARPEALERWTMPVESAFLVQPSPLTAVDAQALAQSYGKTLDLRTAQELVERTGGHPLYLDTLVQTSPRDGTSGPDAGWREAPVPPSVEHAVQARLDLLPFVERDAFARLAVLRSPAAADDLRALGTTSPESALEALVRRGLVTRSISGGVASFRPQSQLVADIAAAALPNETRAGLHRAAAHVIGERGNDEELVGHHLERGGDRMGAAAAYVRAVESALHGGDARRIARCTERALACDPRGSDTLALHLAHLEAARWTGEPSVEERALESAIRLARTEPERARVESERGDWLRRRGRDEEAIAALDRAIALGRSAGLPDLLATACCRRAVLSALHGREREALESLALARAQPAPLALPTLALVEDSSGFVAGCTGDHEKRWRAFGEAARLYARAGDLRRSAGAESNSADAANRLGDLQGAERSLRRALTATRRVGNRLTEGYALMNLGYTLHALGRDAEALDAVGQAIRIAEKAADPRLRAAATLYRCRIEGGPSHDATLATLSEDASATVAALALVLRARRALAQADLAAAQALAARPGARDRDGALEEEERRRSS